MTITSTLLDEIEAKAKAATQSEWKTHLVDDTTIVATGGIEVATTCDSSHAEREDGYNVEYERMEADATYIARMAPPTTLALVAAYRDALNRIAKLESRLEIDHCFDGNGACKDIPTTERDSFPDGIESRDATIGRLEDWVKELKEQLRFADEQAALDDSMADYATRWDGATYSGLELEARQEALQDALNAQPSTPEDPNENDYQRGRFDGVMAYANALRALINKHPS